MTWIVILGITVVVVVVVPVMAMAVIVVYDGFHTGQCTSDIITLVAVVVTIKR